MILAIPLSTPLAKAFSGLQFLLNRVRVLQETVSKFPLSAELDPIFNLVSSWQKLEFESWLALLDDVQIQFEINAEKAQTATKCFSSLEGDQLTLINIYWAFDEFLMTLLNFVQVALLHRASLLAYSSQLHGKDKTAEERRIAICIFDDVLEQCHEAALK